MQKIVINTTHGGFCLNDDQRYAYEQLGQYRLDYWNIPRDCSLLVEVVQQYPNTDLRVVEVPDGVRWVVCDYDGCEWVAEKHRTWHAK